MALSRKMLLRNAQKFSVTLNLTQTPSSVENDASATSPSINTRAGKGCVSPAGDFPERPRVNQYGAPEGGTRVLRGSAVPLARD
eukprot:4461997-Prymnesium_polylepis.1